MFPNLRVIKLKFKVDNLRHSDLLLEKFQSTGRRGRCETYDNNLAEA